MSATAQSATFETVEVELASLRERERALKNNIKLAAQTGDPDAPVREWARELREVTAEIADVNADYERFTAVEAARTRQMALEEYRSLEARAEKLRAKAAKTGGELEKAFRSMEDLLKKLNDLEREYMDNHNAAANAAITAGVQRVAGTDVLGSTGLKPRFLRDLTTAIRHLTPWL